MEKYGFVYIWYDRKHKRYYIGCHWGSEDDGYICSSKWMKDSYKRRPQDFLKFNGQLNRKILSRIYTNKQDLLEEEYKWLSMIKKEKLKIKYYNLHNHKFNHWTNINEINRLPIKEKISIKVKEHYKNNPDKLKEMREREKNSAKDPERNEKISIKTKEAMQRPEVRKKHLKGIESRDQSFMEGEAFKNSRQGGKKNKGRKHTGQALENIQQAAKNKIISEETKEVWKQNGIELGKNVCSKKEVCSKCGFKGNPLNIGRYHNEKCRMIDWISIKSDFIERKISIRKIALKYNIDHKTIINKATKENWN